MLSAPWSDLLVRALLNSSLVLAQALLLNRLGVPFAAVTLFAGIAAYTAAAALGLGFLTFAILVLVILSLVAAFVYLGRLLPDDRYLLLSLAGLALMASFVGASSELGGRIGIACVLEGLPPQDSGAFLLPAAGVFLLACGLAFLLERSQLGLAMDAVRSSRTDLSLTALVPIRRVMLLSFACAIPLALLAGGLQGLYSGRVDPGVFRMDRAIVVLIVTLVAGRSTLGAILVAVSFFALPDLFSMTFGYERGTMAHIREIAWSMIALIAAGYSSSASTRTKAAVDEGGSS